MISKVVSRKPENDHYRALAQYIADTRNEGEKVLLSWCAGCMAGEDYELSILEVEATQTMNTRSKKEKTYHMVVSFRPEDEALLGPEQFKVIEREFAEALGFSEHQRHCGVHKNTNNIHMHVAYNKIHPEKLTIYEPYRDYFKRDKVCRHLEKRFGLVVDVEEKEIAEDITHNKTIPTPPKRRNSRTSDYEAHSGQCSFDAWLKDQKAELLDVLKQAKDWPTLHVGLARYGIQLKPRGAGMVIADLSGRGVKQIHIKASALDKSFAKQRLEERFGPYVAVNHNALPRPIKQYDAAPLHRGYERGHLYKEYQQRVDKRKKSYEQLKQERGEELIRLRQHWAKEQRSAKTFLRWQARKALLSAARMHQLRQEEELNRSYAEKRRRVREETQCDSWSSFLQAKAMQGDETAVAILRSQKKEITPTRTERVHQDIFRDLTYTVDLRGNVLYTLHDGSMVKDNGQEVFFSIASPVAKEAARKLAMRKFGQKLTLSENKFTSESYQEPKLPRWAERKPKRRGIWDILLDR